MSIFKPIMSHNPKIMSLLVLEQELYNNLLTFIGELSYRIIIMNLDSSKPVYVIFHGQHQLLDSIKHKLFNNSFKEEQIKVATLDKAGELGDYVAMLWPPIKPTHIVINEIIGTDSQNGKGMGAWSKIEQRELFKISL